MKRFKNRLCLEQPENRQMMAGDIQAINQFGVLRINEAPGHVGGAQNVIITQSSDGKVTLTGTTSPVNLTGSLINGKGFDSFFGVTRIEANLGNGQDVIGIGGSANQFKIADLIINTTSPNSTTNDADIVTLNNVQVARALEITTGAGKDTVRVLNSSIVTNPATQFARFKIDTGVQTTDQLADRDEVIMTNVSAAVDVSVKTGGSNDLVTMRNSRIGTTADHLLWFDLGSGHDTIHLGSTPNTYEAVTGVGSLRIDAGKDAENDVDFVRMEDVFFGQGLSAQMGGGGDRIEMENVQVQKGMSLNGHSGDDIFALKGVQAMENFFAKMGDGNDLLEITFLKTRKMDIDGGVGLGYDMLRIYDSANIPTVIRTNFEEINGQKVVNKKGAK